MKGREVAIEMDINEGKKSSSTHLGSPVPYNFPLHPKRALWWRLKSLLTTPDES